LPLYLLAVFKALASYESIRYTIVIDRGVPVAGEFLLVSAGNGARAGGGFYMNPGARPNDGMIDLCTARRMSRARMLTILPGAIRGAHVRRRGVDTHRGAAITIAAERPFPIHIDGEYLGRLAGPFEMKIMGRCLPVLSRRGGAAWREDELERLLPR
jgi:diacylglycerol kinase family enzyme